MEGSSTVEQRKDLPGREGTSWDSDINGLIYRSGDCCFSACTFSSDHYHCQACGVGTNEVSQALAHIRSSPACRKDPLVHYSSSSVAMAADPTNTLYNAIYNGFNAQSTYPSPAFGGYNQIDSFQWHPSMSEKVTICSSQLSPCCSSNGPTFIPVESQLCSPLSDLYSKVAPIRDLVSLPAKSSGSAVDSPAWFASYNHNPQQTQKSAYKYTDQNPSSQINFVLLDPSDQKHQDGVESSASLPSNFCGKSDFVGKDVLKESYCSFSSQPLPGILSEDALFSLQLQDDTLKQADVQQTSVSQILSDVTSSKNIPQTESIASTPRAETHFTQEHFGHYIPACSAYPPVISQDANLEESTDANHPASSAASESDESDIIVEDTGDELASQMTESEIFIEDIKCSLLQGVVSEVENQTGRASEVFESKVGINIEHSREESEQTRARAVTKVQTESQLKNCLSSYHTFLKCVICEKSVADGSPGSVFVQMSSEMPLTTSSQTPVLTKLNEVVAIEVTDFLDVNGKFMCQHCFNLVDTVDSLESKLESLKQNIAAMVKAGAKPLLVNHSQCVKLSDHMIEQNQSDLLNMSPSIKNSSPPVNVENIQELFQETLVNSPSIAKRHQGTNDVERKEYLVLSGQALSLTNNMSKVSVSLGQHHSTNLGQGQCQSQNVAIKEACNLPKPSDVSSTQFNLTSVESVSKSDRKAITSNIAPYCLSHKTLDSKEEPVQIYQPLECQKECLATANSIERKDEGNHIRMFKEDMVLGMSFKDIRNSKEGNDNRKLSLTPMRTEQVEQQIPHSSDCIIENCHEMLRLERTMEENVRRESCVEQQSKFSCDLCGELFSSDELLQNHLSLYSKSESSLCELCGQLYHNQIQLDNHMFDAHFVYQKHCKLCAAQFFHPCLFKKHLQTHYRKKMSYSSQCARANHGNNPLKRGKACSETPPFVCNKCNQTFQMRSHLEHHIKATHVLKKALSKCDQCDRTFIKPSDLQAHKRSHSNEKKYECKVCGHRFKSISNLNHHSKSHEVKKPFTCDVCSQGFTRKDFFETHLNSHKDEKPFKCEKCLKGFSCKAYLQVHFKWHQDKIKKVTCPICNKTFSQRLNVHMRSHTGERPHPCEKCPKKFITGSALRKHVKRIHREDFPSKSAYPVSDGSGCDPVLSDSDEPKSPLSCLHSK